MGWWGFALKSGFHFVNRLLLRAGFQLARSSRLVSPVFGIKGLEDIIAAGYEWPNSTLVVNLPLAKGRGKPRFSWGKDGSHPFIGVAREGLLGVSSSDREARVSRYLRNFYSEFTPKDFSELLGLPLDASPGPAKVAPWAGAFPWEPSSQDGSLRKGPNEVSLFEGLSNGLKTTIEDGWTWCGPATEKKVSLETRRMTRLIENLNREGYRRTNLGDGDIRGVILARSTDEWVWQSTTGQHRAAALSALGFAEVPIRISTIVWESDAAHWPRVLSGDYSVGDALDVFAAVFQERPSLR